MQFLLIAILLSIDKKGGLMAAKKHKQYNHWKGNRTGSCSIILWFSFKRRSTVSEETSDVSAANRATTDF